MAPDEQVWSPEMQARARVIIRSAGESLDAIPAMRERLRQLQEAHEKRLARWAELGFPEWVITRENPGRSSSVIGG